VQNKTKQENRNQQKKNASPMNKLEIPVAEIDKQTIKKNQRRR